MDNRIGELRVFVAVVAGGSFSAAAKRLRMTPSTVSKLIARIEQRLNVRLIERSTRHLSLTLEGEQFHERAVALLEDLDDLEHCLARGAGVARGVVRVNVSVALGTLAVLPWLPDFHAAYPNVTVDLSLSDQLVDLYLDRTDVAIRVGRLPDSSLMARRLGTTRRKIVASPAYLARAGTPRHLDDLAEHVCLGFNFRRSASLWPAHANVPFLLNNGETVRQLALAGAGLARLGGYHARADLAAGRLVEVLPDAGLDDVEEMHALTRGAQRMPQRVRVFLDYAVPRLQAFLSEAD